MIFHVQIPWYCNCRRDDCDLRIGRRVFHRCPVGFATDKQNIQRGVVKRNVVAAIAIVVIVAAAIFSIGAFQYSHKNVPSALDSITIGMEPNQVNTLIFVADENGYFAENGLNITLKNYPSGAAAVDGMLAGEVDIATATEFVLASQALAHDHVRTFASIDRFHQIYIIGRNDRGIWNASDLKGKTIGLSRKTNTEFYLGRYLFLQGIELQDVTVTDINVQQFTDVLANGTVDAVVVWQPYAQMILDQMQTGLVVWPAQSGQGAYCTVITTDDWLSQHPAPAERFLNALALAETDVIQDPAAVKILLGKRLNYDSAYIDVIWPEHQFSLSLDQSLILAMEDEARWKIANNMTNATDVPDFREHVSTQSLETVKPGLVRIIR
jgi:ABC-type nitrate/sulfonate/bicarbonate transport system substrate-binding protein